jgi:hypothetical protein
MARPRPRAMTEVFKLTLVMTAKRIEGHSHCACRPVRHEDRTGAWAKAKLGEAIGRRRSSTETLSGAERC